MKKITIVVPLLVLIFLAGCGDPKVTGKVTFPDGTPLTKGQVLFQKEGFVAAGDIRSDGTYSAGKNKDGDGLPPGKYEVFIAGATMAGELQNAPAPSEGLGSADSRAHEMAETIHLVHRKYTNPNTSGLTVEVKNKAVKFDITVEPPQ